MRAHAILLALACAGTACKADVVQVEQKAKLTLSRSTDGRIEVLLTGAQESPRAIEVELEIAGSDAFLLQDAAAPEGVPLDTVKVRMRGANRAILFAGDKRGARLSRSGAVARFRAEPAGGATGARGELRIVRAVVAGAEGTAIETDLGGALPIP